MTAPRSPRRRTGDKDLDQRLTDLLDAMGTVEDRDLLFEMLATVVRMARDGVDRLNLKITSAALREMRQAFRVFAPFRSVPKVTIFGSARTLPDDPLYIQTRNLAAALAQAGWMVVTGAGPGIMAAGVEGAGRERSIGVNIRLPFEQDANPFIAADPKLVSMKYFFTRKLMLMKESAGFAVLPGGFGTLDETFELLTLLQTGKAAPAPLVLVDVPGGTYWKAWDHFIREELAQRGLVSADDLLLCRITDDVEEAVGEILGFFRNYHSIRYVGPILVVRMRARPTDEELATLNDQFGDICVEGGIEASDPLPEEVADGDQLDLPRITLAFDRASLGRLRALIDTLNRLPAAPPLAIPEPSAADAAGAPPETGGASEEAEPEEGDELPLDPPLAELLAAAASGDGTASVHAVERLRAVLEAGEVDAQQQRAVAAELCRLVLVTPDRRAPLLDAVAAASPFVALDLVLELLNEHSPTMDENDVNHLVRALDRLLTAAEASSPRGQGAAGLAQVALLLHVEDPLPVLDAIARSNGKVAPSARAARDRVTRIRAGLAAR